MKYELLEIESLKFAIVNKEMYLIDTGSPYSFFKKGSALIEGVKYENGLFKEILEKRMDELSKYIKPKTRRVVKGIIGSDIISKTGLTINKKEAYVLFEETKFNPKGFFTIDLKEVNNQTYIVFPCLKLRGMVYMGEYSYVLDTGSLVSIFNKDLCAHAQYAYRKDFYYPSLGRTITLDFMFFDLNEESKIRLICGSNIDKEIDEQLEFIGVDGELSFNDFEYEILSIDIKNKKILWS